MVMSVACPGTRFMFARGRGSVKMNAPSGFSGLRGFCVAGGIEM